MATVHVGRMQSAVGVGRTVAIKRVHPHFAHDPDFASMFLDEARLSLRIQHPNVVPTFDVVAEAGELLLVMDYVHGDSLSSLLREASRRGEAVPPLIASAILGGVLAGLHAAHELRDENGLPLGLVHRDISPQNVLVGVDGVARVLDFGVAKAAGRTHSTEQGKVKGKVAYMAPEQLVSAPVDRRADVFGASVVLWEVLTGKRLFERDDVGAMAVAVLSAELLPPSSVNGVLDDDVDRVVMKGLSRHVELRYASAEAMAIDLEQVLPPAPSRAVGEWVQRIARDKLASRVQFVAEVESTAGAAAPRPPDESTRSGIDEVPSELAEVGAVTATTPAVEQGATLASATITTDSAQPKKARASRWIVIGAAAVIVFGGAGIWYAVRQGSRGPTAATTATESAVGTSAAATATVTSTATESSTAVASASAATSTPPSESATAHAPSRPRAPSPRPASSKPRTNCANPFYVNANGIRVPRPECF
jgi:serine/threonine-protein kinase